MQVLDRLSDLPADALFDAVVIGAGGAGLATALFAALEGQRVLLVERTEQVGGTTAWSAGTTWIPGTHHAAQVNPADTLDEAARYLDNAIGERAPRELREAFLRQGAQAVARLERETDVQLRPYAKHPDYISDLGGSTLNGRAMEPVPFDGRLLGPLFARVRPPIPEFTVLGGMMVDRTDINHLLGMTRSLASLRHSLGLLGRHLRDRLRHSRGTRLVMGNALVARLLYSLSRQGQVTLLFGTELAELQREGGAGAVSGAVSGVVLRQGGLCRRVGVAGGVVMASGGFNRHPARRAELLPGADIAWCPGAPGHTGAAQDVALAAGARYGEGAFSHAFWAPVSLRRRADGSTAVFPHFVMDRAKPGFITVNQQGRRFVNESTSYHLFGLAMQRAGAVPAYLVCDSRALKAYGIGMVRPGGRGLAPFLADGYLTEGRTLDELAARLGVDADGLRESVERINRYALAGTDPDFQRGTTAYQHNIGDATRGLPNPNLGPLDQAPYYAVKLYPGDIGSATGLRTDARARVLDAGGRAIPGLYAVGNDMHSIMGGVYTGPGITVGPGLVFASLAAQDLAQRDR